MSSPETIRATLPNELPKAVSEMLQELDFILWMSTDAGLMQPRNMTLIQGGFERGDWSASSGTGTSSSPI